MTLPAIGGIDCGEAEHVDQKRRQLEALGSERFGALGEIGILGEQARVMEPQHAGARARRRHHIVEALEGLDHLAGDRHGVAPVAGIIGGLPAAGLRARHLDPAAPRLDQLDRGKGDAWPEQIDEAGDEQADKRALLCGRRGSHGAGQALHVVAGDGSQDVASAGATQEIRIRGCIRPGRTRRGEGCWHEPWPCLRLCCCRPGAPGRPTPSP